MVWQATLVLCALTVAGPARSQELEPRSYSKVNVDALGEQLPRLYRDQGDLQIGEGV